MVAPTRKTLILTLGLGADSRHLLDTRFASFPQYQFGHHDGWSPDILRCDVILVDLDSAASHDALEMMREFRGVREPLLVLFSAADDHLSGKSEEAGDDSIPGLCRRLRDVLPNLDCSRATASKASVEVLERGVLTSHRQGGLAS